METLVFDLPHYFLGWTLWQFYLDLHVSHCCATYPKSNLFRVKSTVTKTLFLSYPANGILYTCFRDLLAGKRYHGIGYQDACALMQFYHLLTL
jgi:hypothetical protein